MKTFKHIVFTRFDTHSATKFDSDWLKYRIEIFKKYTLSSLLNQNNKNFVLLIRYCWDFYDEVQELNRYLETTGIKCFFTYFDTVNDKKIKELNEYEGFLSDIQGEIIFISPLKELTKKDGKMIFLLGFTIRDDSGRIAVKVWGLTAVDVLKKIEIGQIILLRNVLVKFNDYSKENEIVFTQTSSFTV